MSEAAYRLFVSSPGDVAAERARAEAVVEKLNVEFKDRARFDALFWEDRFYSTHETFQKQIPEAADFDLVIAISAPASARPCNSSSALMASPIRPAQLMRV